MPLFRRKGGFVRGSYGARRSTFKRAASAKGRSKKKGTMRTMRKVKSAKTSRLVRARGAKRRKVPGGRAGGRYRSGGGVLVRGARQHRAQYNREASGIKGHAIGSSGPLRSGKYWDKYIQTAGTTNLNVDPGASNQVFGYAFFPGDDFATMVTNIRTESPFTLVGGAYVLMPTLYVCGYTVFDVYAASNSSARFELCLFTSRDTKVLTPTTALTTFATAWTASYDALPAAYPNFPSTSLLENRSFWSPNYFKLAGRRTGIARPGRPVRLTFKFKTRRLTYDEYSNSSGVPSFAGVHFKDKTYSYVMKFSGEMGQACGTDGVGNKPILTEINGNIMVKRTTFYRYTWAPGSANQKPTIYGSVLGSGESVNEDALCWTSVPALKATRAAAGIDITGAGGVYFGALDIQSRHQTTLNPYADCVGDLLLPQVEIPP